MYAVLTQVIGFIGTGLIVGSFQCKRSRRLFLMQLASNFFYFTHFMMLGAYAGGISVLVGLARNLLLCSKRPWADKPIWPWVFAIAHMVVVVFTWAGPLTLLAGIGPASTALVSWSRNGKRVRLVSVLINSPCWLVYDFFTGSISGVVCELFCMSSVAVSVIRYGWKALDVNEDQHGNAKAS